MLAIDRLSLEKATGKTEIWRASKRKMLKNKKWALSRAKIE